MFLWSEIEIDGLIFQVHREYGACELLLVQLYPNGSPVKQMSYSAKKFTRNWINNVLFINYNKWFKNIV